MKFIYDEPTGSARGMTMTPTRETIQRRFSLVQGLRVAHACFLQTRDRKKGKSKPIFKLGLPTVARVITSAQKMCKNLPHLHHNPQFEFPGLFCSILARWASWLFM